MAKVKLYGPDGRILELWQGIGFVRTPTSWADEPPAPAEPDANDKPAD